MRNKIFGVIGIVWGGFMTFQWIMATSHHAVLPADAVYSAGYETGQWVAHIFGVLILLAGIYYLFKKAKPSA